MPVTKVQRPRVPKIAHAHLIDTVRRRLVAQKGDWPQISSSAQVGYRWMCSFASGEYTDCRLSLIVRLALAMNMTIVVRDRG